MASEGFVRLPERGVLALSGPDHVAFLDGLASNAAAAVTEDRASYAALLTPQGKFLFDFLMYRSGDSLLLETEADRLPDLLRRLTLYRLRAKVRIEDAGDRLAVAALLVGPETLERLVGRADSGACRVIDDGLVAVDPRLAALGGRALLPPDRLEAVLTGHGLAPLPRTAYEERRMASGVPDGARDMTAEKAILLENGFEELNGVSFTKGCYVGQELTARTKHRGLIKKRLVPVDVEGPTPEPGTQVTLDGRDAGEMRTGVAGLGLALLRLEKMAAAASSGGELRAGEAVLRPRKPAWANF